MVIKSGYLKTVGHAPFKMEALEGKDWENRLRQALSLVELKGFNVQLGSGTLLGYVREEDRYIHYDTDLDIDVIVDKKNIKNLLAQVDDLIASFHDNGYKLIRTQHYGQLPSQVAFIHTKDDIIVDLCFFYNLWDNANYYNVYEHGIFIRPEYSLETTEIDGMPVPDKYKKYLTGRYGKDWKTPTNKKQCGSLDAADYLILL